jgi:hypothetical protein
MGQLRFDFWFAFAAALGSGCATQDDTQSGDLDSSGETDAQPASTGGGRNAGGSRVSDAGPSADGSPGTSGATKPVTGGATGSGGATKPATGGSNGTGGATGSGGATKPATGGSTGTGGVQPTVTACDALPAAGTWENITPPNIDLDSTTTPNSNVNFGTAALRLNPQSPAQIYLGTETWGFYGSKDCGSKWVKLNTGRSAAEMDAGNQWTMAVDPTDPQVLYSNSGFAVGGVFKSTNGGVDWDNVLTSATVTGSLPFSVIPYSGFIGTFSIDPGDHLHIVSSFHSGCNAPADSMCFIETSNGGTTWTVRNIIIAGVSGGEHTLLEFLTSTRWLFGTQSAVFISDDSGSHWTQIPGTHSIVHHQQTYRTASGHFFQSTWEGLMYSPDGAFNTWTMVAGSPTAAVGVAGDGTHVWTSYAGPWNAPCAPNLQPYYETSETSPGTMTQMTSPKMRDGGLFMAYDPTHHVLYSSNFCGGVWRMVTQ